MTDAPVSTVLIYLACSSGLALLWVVACVGSAWWRWRRREQKLAARMLRCRRAVEAVQDRLWASRHTSISEHGE